MNLGEFLGGAGVVDAGWRQSTDAQRSSRMEELRRQEVARQLAEQERVREMQRALDAQGSVSRSVGLAPELAAAMPGANWGTGPVAPQPQPAGLKPAGVKPAAQVKEGARKTQPQVRNNAAAKDISAKQGEKLGAPSIDESKLPQHVVDNSKIQAAGKWYGQNVYNTGAAGLNFLLRVGTAGANAGARLVNAATDKDIVKPREAPQISYFDTSNIYQNTLRENAGKAGLSVTDMPQTTASTAGKPAASGKVTRAGQKQPRPQTARDTASTQFTVQPEPSATADAVVTAATGGIMYGTADAPMQNPHIQGVLAQRQMLVDRIKTMEQYGFGDRALELVPQIQAIDAGLYKVAADQSIYEASLGGNFSRAMSIVSSMSGQPHQVLDRGDGTYDYYVNGAVVKPGIDKVTLLDMLQSRIDESYVARKNARNDKIFEHQLKLEELITEKGLDAKGKIEAAYIKAQATVASAGADKTKPIPVALDDGDVFVLDPMTRTATLYRKNGVTQEVKGVPVTSMTGQTMALPGGR